MWIAGRALLGVAESGGRAVESRDPLEKGEDRLTFDGIWKLIAHARLDAPSRRTCQALSCAILSHRSAAIESNKIAPIVVASYDALSYG
jgi:hypothetical protein